MKGQGLTPVIGAYTQLFVTAVVDRQSHLKMEILKNLGDLYLEKGKVDRDEAAFTKAVGLYRAALDRCEDSSGRETLKHRIKYAEKVRERVMKKRRETRLTGNENPPMHRPTSGQAARHVISQENDAGTYQDLLEEGCKAQQTGDLDRAELKFAAALKAVHVTDEHWKETEPLIKLSDVYLKRGMTSNNGGSFTKAAALCNAALVRARTEDKKDIRKTILEITRSFIRDVLGIEQTVDIGNAEKHKLILEKNRDYVEKEIRRIEQQVDPYRLEDNDPKIRQVEKKRAEEIKALFQTIAEQRRTFIASLTDECMEVMGPPPCKYAMIGLGSQATGLVTPYSDLEFAILIGKETEKGQNYFHNLTHYLHLKVINLGETILPAMGIKSLNDFSSDDPLNSWFYDSVTPRGFAFDGAMPHACKTPLGRGKTHSLICTPRSMIKVLQDDVKVHLKKGYHLASILGNVSLITGEQDLVDEYSALWEQQLKKDKGKISREIAKTTLSENMEAFRREGLTAGIPDVKIESFSISSLMDTVRTFAAQTPSARLIDVKKEMYRFSSLAVSSWALICNIQPGTIWETIQKMLKEGIINSENAHHLMVLVSISAELRLRTYMNNRTLWRNLGDYRKAIGFYEQALQLNRSIHGENTAHPQIASSLFNLGNAWNGLGGYRKAISYYEQTLQMDRSIYGEDTAHVNIFNSLRALGSTWNELGDDRKAISYQEQSLKMRRTIFGENTDNLDNAHSLTSLGLRRLSFGDHGNALSYFEQSLQMERRIYGENTAHPNIAKSLNNLGMACSDLGDYKKAVSYHEQSLQMKRSIYGEKTTHDSIANSLTNLGITWRGLGDHRKALIYHEQSLEMERVIYGENTPHPDIAKSLVNLGCVWRDLGDPRKSMGYLEQSIKMQQRIFGENSAHADIAKSLNHLGVTIKDLDDHSKAIKCFQQALQMRQKLYGESTAHPEIAESLNCLGTTWGNIGDHRKTIMYFEQSLSMMRTIYGENSKHPDIAMALASLGKAWCELGDSENVISCYQQLQLLK
ncbi:TTC28 [Branchiostoma lanceolatum]|uniref:TTC28 protein n=1 Tax=Branchiostoma lanceolatum TaxID=7740 RepID=A0A8J9ZMM5_BRALA|nr:TTC28 [Branchiostoma lanceolatum]